MSGPSHIAPQVHDFLDRSRYPGRRVVARREPHRQPGPRHDRDAVLGRQRLPRPARQRRRGPRLATRTAPTSTASTRPGRSSTPRRRSASPGSGQTIVNAPDAKVIRLYVDDEPLLLPIADLDGVRASPRLPLRRDVPRDPVAYARRQAGADPLAPHGVVHAAAPRDHDVRGHDARRLRARGDLVADPQPPGRRGRVPRPLQGDGRRRRPAQGQQHAAPRPDPAEQLRQRRRRPGRRWATSAPRAA